MNATPIDRRKDGSRRDAFWQILEDWDAKKIDELHMVERMGKLMAEVPIVQAMILRAAASQFVDEHYVGLLDLARSVDEGRVKLEIPE